MVLLINELKFLKVNWIILAGFLKKIPLELTTRFPNRIINIHPALLPKYGGKGMYGINVHKAVLENQETKSGITIHYVNEHYDEGSIIFQSATHISECKTPESIQKKIQQLEHHYYPLVIEQLVNNKPISFSK